MSEKQFVVRCTKQQGVWVKVAHNGIEVDANLKYMAKAESDYITRNMRLMQEQGFIDIIQKPKVQVLVGDEIVMEPETVSVKTEPVPPKVEVLQPAELTPSVTEALMPKYSWDELEAMTKKELHRLAETNMIPAKGMSRDELLMTLFEANIAKG